MSDHRQTAQDKPTPKRGQILNLIMDDEGFFLPDENRFFPMDEGAGKTLSGIFDAKPGLEGLKVYYQKRDILVLFLGPGSGTISQAIQAKLPPGKSLGDYQLAFFKKIAALVPAASLRELFRFAESRQIATCRVCAFPKLEQGSFRIQLRRQQWFMKVEHGVPERMLPLPETGSFQVPDFEQEPFTLDFQNKPFAETLFEWVDPREKQRLAARKNRKLLALATALSLGLLLLGGLGLWNWRRVSENRLLALSVEHRIEKKQIAETQRIQSEIEQLLAQAQDLNQKRGASSAQAAGLRRIMNHCPDTTLLQSLRFYRGLQGEPYYFLSGYAADPTTASVLLQALESDFKNWKCIMNRLTELPQKRGTEQDDLPKQFRYQFEISLDPRS